MGEPTKNASAAPAVDPLLGRVINGRFKVLSVLARGGMGKVYRAEQSPLGRIVALKVLNPNYSGENDPEFHKRFFLEASVVAKLSHTNTVTLYDYGQTDDGVYFMAMECLEGRTLHRRLRDEGPVEPMRALHIALQVCRSLREAHGLGVIHRDLKPANVFLIRRDDDADFVKVLDFGLVKPTDAEEESLTQTGLFMGSPKYMAPEQIRGERVSPATDVYALGVILFEMLTGRVPFDKPNSVNLLMAHVSEPVPALAEVNPACAAPLAVEEMVYRCLSKRPEDRFGSMDELIAEIKRIAMGAMPSGALMSGTGEFMSSLAPPVLPSGEHPVRPSVAPESRVPSPLPPPLPSAPPAAVELASTEVAVPVLGAPAPVPAPVVIDAPAPARSKGLVLAGVGLFALSVVAGFAMHAASRRTPPPVAPAAIAPAVTPPTVTPPTVTPPTVTVAIESDPSGAEVFEGETRLGRTPLRETWTGARGDPSAEHAFTVRAEGYAPETVRGSGAAIALAVRLRPLVTDAGAAVRARVRPRGRPAAGAGPTAPAGYRNDVY